MRIPINHLEPNPFRNIKDYPINREKVESLKQSISQTSFWDNLLVRPKPEEKGNYQIAYGHHRLMALKELNIKEAELPVRDIDDATMIRIMANENLDSWKTAPAVVIETVRAVKEFLDGELAKCNNYEEFRSDKCIRPNFPEVDSEPAFRSIKAKGVGRDTILKFLGSPWKQWMVQEALSALEDSEKGKIDIEAVKVFDRLSQAREFRDAVKEHDIPKHRQKQLAQKIITEEIGRDHIKDYITDTVAVLKPTPKKKPEQPPDLNVRLEELVKLMAQVRTYLSRLTDYLQFAQRHLLYDFYSEIGGIKNLLEKIPEKNKLLEGRK